jgi:hypothetical protein
MRSYEIDYSLIDRCAVTGPAHGSGAKRRSQGLDEVSTAFSAAQPPRTLNIYGFIRSMFVVEIFINKSQIEI